MGCGWRCETREERRRGKQGGSGGAQKTDRTEGRRGARQGSAAAIAVASTHAPHPRPPLVPPGEFGMPLAGTGFSAPSAWLNRLQWRSLDLAVARTLHLPRAQSIVDQAVAAAAATAAAGGQGSSSSGRGSISAEVAVAAAADMEAAHALLVSRTRLQRGLAPAPVPTLYIWSPALLPKPADWPANTHVVGPLLLRRQQQPQPQPAAAAPAPPVVAPPVVVLAAAMAPGTQLQPAALALPLAVSSRAARSSSGGDSAGIMPRTPQRGSGEPAPKAAVLDGSAPPSPTDQAPPAALPTAAPVTAAVATPALSSMPVPVATGAAPDECVGLPAALQAYLDDASRWGLWHGQPLIGRVWVTLAVQPGRIPLGQSITAPSMHDRHYRRT